jgi:hypothetical protein
VTNVRSILGTLTKEKKAELTQRLYKAQNEICYVCRKIINLAVHETDIDHIIALARNGLDEEQNWGLTHLSCNRSKGARDLQLQRILCNFKEDIETHGNAGVEGSARNFTVNEALDELYPDRQEVGAVIRNGSVKISFNLEGRPQTEEFPIIEDLPGFQSFVGMIPFMCLHHDSTINPRSIVDLEPMIEEFYNGNPQLQPSLATLQFDGKSGKGKILLFDGQHKAAANMYLGRSRLFVRTFVNCDKNRLKETNFRAHTRLAQIHFPQLVEDRVGDDLFLEEFNRFLANVDVSKKSENSFFHEHLPQPLRSDYRKYFASHLRYEVLTGKAGTKGNEILNYVETITARSKRYPHSYDTVQKTFLAHFLWLKPSKEPLELTQKMRALERENLIRLMNVFVEEILAGNRFDLGKGIYRIEERLAEAPDTISDSHLRAYRLCRSSALMIWSEELMRAISLLLNTLSKYEHSEWPKERPMWAEIEPPIWDRIRKMIRVVRDHKIWGERTSPAILSAISSTRQRDWREILSHGRLPGRQDELLPKVDQNHIFQNSQ